MSRALTVPCEPCKGTGLALREAQEGDAVLHPVLSRTPGLCQHCGGMGRISKTKAEVQAAAAADG